MNKNPLRRWTDKIRILADEMWELGKKELSTDLHGQAAKAEQERKNDRRNQSNY